MLPIENRKLTLGGKLSPAELVSPTPLGEVASMMTIMMMMMTMMMFSKYCSSFPLNLARGHKQGKQRVQTEENNYLVENTCTTVPVRNGTALTG